MANLDFDFTPVQRDQISWGGPGGHVGVVNYADRKNVFFYVHAVDDPQKSMQMGRPIKMDKIFIEIGTPGERLTVVRRPATREDASRYPQQWAQFQQNKPQMADGTPLDNLFPANPSIADNLRASGIHTVEQLADLSGDAMHNIMGAQDYVNKAKKYIERAEKGVGFHRHEKDLAERDQKIKVLEQQLEQAMAAIRNMQQQIDTRGMVGLGGAIAGQSLHPTFPSPVPPPPQPFDAQSAQIAATSPTAQITQAQKTRRSRVSS